MGVIFRGGVPYSTRSQNTPMLINVDGMDMEPEYLADINPNDVESVEVLRSGSYTAIYGSKGGGGVLLITTKRGGSDNNYVRYSPGILTYSPKGYYKSREFYSPQYDDPKTKAQMPDLRTTIFWKPNIITDKDGNASFDFFNADNKATYRVIVEGIDGNGNLGRQVYRYKLGN
jgi:TonB-dependent SusC/RagA subfamily outer membrane receptor